MSPAFRAGNEKPPSVMSLQVLDTEQSMKMDDRKERHPRMLCGRQSSCCLGRSVHRALLGTVREPFVS